MSPRVVLLSLSLDLKRITTAIQRDSSAVLKFNDEASGWLVQAQNLGFQNLDGMLLKIKKTLGAENNLEKAEDCLMYSFLVQNRALALN